MPRRVVTAVVGCDDTAVKSGVVCAPGCPPAQPSTPHTTSSRVSIQTEAADLAQAVPVHEYDATGAKLPLGVLTPNIFS